MGGSVRGSFVGLRVSDSFSMRELWEWTMCGEGVVGVAIWTIVWCRSRNGVVLEALRGYYCGV